MRADQQWMAEEQARRDTEQAATIAALYAPQDEL